jgi:hypothetical protein
MKHSFLKRFILPATALAIPLFMAGVVRGQREGLGVPGAELKQSRRTDDIPDADRLAIMQNNMLSSVVRVTYRVRIDGVDVIDNSTEGIVVSKLASDTAAGQSSSVGASMGVVSKGNPSERILFMSLNERSEVNFNQIPLSRVMQLFSEQYNIPIVIDEIGLKEQNITSEEPISLVLPEVSFRSALNLILKPLRLTYVIEDEVLRITGPNGTAPKTLPQNSGPSNVDTQAYAIVFPKHIFLENDPRLVIAAKDSNRALRILTVAAIPLISGKLGWLDKRDTPELKAYQGRIESWLSDINQNLAIGKKPTFSQEQFCVETRIREPEFDSLIMEGKNAFHFFQSSVQLTPYSLAQWKRRQSESKSLPSYRVSLQSILEPAFHSTESNSARQLGSVVVDTLGLKGLVSGEKTYDMNEVYTDYFVASEKRRKFQEDEKANDPFGDGPSGEEQTNTLNGSDDPFESETPQPVTNTSLEIDLALATLAKNAKDSSDTKRKTAIAALRDTIANQFDEQQKMKRLKIESLRVRLDQLTQSEQQHAMERQQIIEAKLQALLSRGR